jgi:hypothetical protein
VVRSFRGTRQIAKLTLCASRRFITPTRPDKDYLKEPAFRAGYPLLAKHGLRSAPQLPPPLPPAR